MEVNTRTVRSLSRSTAADRRRTDQVLDAATLPPGAAGSELILPIAFLALIWSLWGTNSK